MTKKVFNAPQFEGYVDKNLFVAYTGDLLIGVEREFRIVVAASGSTTPLVKVEERKVNAYREIKIVREELCEYLKTQWPIEVGNAVIAGRAWILLPYASGQYRLQLQTQLADIGLYRIPKAAT